VFSSVFKCGGNMMKEIFFRSCMLTGFSMLVACGGTGQDEGSRVEISQIVSGRAIDGGLARATVYVDTNNNGARDAWESWAFTDDDGFFSYNPKTDTNYCAATATGEQQQYCLNIRTQRDNAILRVVNGYDVMTGEPFQGQLSRRIRIGDDTEEDSQTLISPLTTLVSTQETEQEQQQILSRLSLTRDDLDTDYTETGASDHLLNAALKVHKTVTVLSDRLTDTYREIGENVGTPHDATPAVYSRLAAQLMDSQDGLDTLLANENSMVSVIDQAEVHLRNIYRQRDYSLPADMDSTNSAGEMRRAVRVTTQMNQALDRLLPSNGTSSPSDRLGAVRAVESLVIKATREGSSRDSSVDNALAFFNSDTNTSLLEALRSALSQSSADVSLLASNDFVGDDFDSPEDFTAQVQLPEGARPFADIAGKMIHLSDPDLGYAPNHLKDYEVQIYFDESSVATSGDLLACAKYIEDANIDGTLGEGNTRGTLVYGFWSLLGAGDSAESYSLLLTLEFLGGAYQAVVKPSGNIMVDGEEKMALRFDFDGEMRDWHTEQGFTVVDTLPERSADCEARLPSRVGL